MYTSGRPDVLLHKAEARLKPSFSATETSKKFEISLEQFDLVYFPISE